jgi:hypothetical protein
MRVFTLLALISISLSGCKKKDEAKADPKTVGTKPAETRPGDKPAAGGTTVVVKHNFEEYDGNYDGAKALFLKHHSGETHIAIGRNCEKFDCDHVDVFGYARDAMKAACPKAQWAVINFGDGKTAKVGENMVTANITSIGGGTSFTGNRPDIKVTITDLGADVVKGRVDYKESDEVGILGQLEGGFTAKVCPTPQ